MQFITKRLWIRELMMKDVPDLLEGVGNLRVSRNLLKVPHPYTKKEAEAWVKKNLGDQKMRRRTDYALVLELKAERKVIGAVGLHSVDAYQGTAEIGYWLNESYHRKGYMSEAVAVILDFALKKLKLRRISLNAFAENVASNELAKKFGFKFEGTARQAVRSLADGKVHSEHRYSLLREEWLGRKRK